MKPNVSIALNALADQAEASLRDYLADYPTFLADLADNRRSREMAQTVAVDVLAVLSECWETPVENRLNVVTARLLAWQRITET